MTIIVGCTIFMVGVILQTASAGLGLLVAGRLIAGFGVGFVSAIIILYMSECSPKKIRGAVVAGYQFAITIGLLLAACVAYATQDRMDTGSYRIPIAIQMLWALLLGGGIFFYQTHRVISSNAENLTKPPTPCLAYEVNPSHPTSSKTSLLRLSPTTNTSCRWFLRVATGAAGPIASREVSGNLAPISAAPSWVLRCR